MGGWPIKWWLVWPYNTFVPLLIVFHICMLVKKEEKLKFSDILLNMHSLYIMTQHPAIPKYCRNHRVYYKAQRNDCLPKARTIILLYNINSYFLCWQILAYRSIPLMVSLHSSPLSFFGINFLSASNLRQLKCI